MWWGLDWRLEGFGSDASRITRRGFDSTLFRPSNADEIVMEDRNFSNIEESILIPEDSVMIEECSSRTVTVFLFD